MFFCTKLPPKVDDSPKVLVHVDCSCLVHQQKADEGDKQLQWELNRWNSGWSKEFKVLMNSKTCCSIVLQVVSQQNQVFLTIEIFISLGLRARVLFIPTSYPGPLGQMGPSRKTYSSQVHLDTGVAVAQRATGPLVILSPPAVCKLWRLIGRT